MTATRTIPWLPLWAFAVLGAGGFHMLEHIIQTYQKYALASDHAHGLLGKYLDSDWIHLAYNGLFFLALLPIARAGGDRGDVRWRMFLVGLVLGGYHVVEHSVKTWQSVMLGHDPALGIVGHLGPLILVHLALNAVVYSLVAPHLLACARRWRLAPARRAASVRAP